MERLENQLVGQYLRAHNSKYGIYLLGIIDPHRRHWIDESGTPVNFDQLIDKLRARANELMAQRNDIRGIAIIGIDFRQIN